MKKTIYSVIVIVSAFVLAVSCTKEVGNLKEEKEQAIDPAPVDPTPVEPFSITVTIPQDMTKISFEQENKGEEGDKVKLTWDDADELVIMDNENPTNNRVFIIPPSGISGDGKTATFIIKPGQPDMFIPSSGKYDILYGAASLEDALAKDYASQTQTGNASLDGLENNYIALITGVNTIDNIELSKTWAEANGGTFKETGIIRLWLQMPVATSITSATINAPTAIFYRSNAQKLAEMTSSLRLTFTGGATPDGSDHNTVTGYLMMPWEDITITAATPLTVIVRSSVGKSYSKTFTPSATEAKTFTTGRINAIKLSSGSLTEIDDDIFFGGAGSSGDPYLIATPAQLLKVSSVLAPDETKYFKLVDDIDMTGASWTPLNNETPYSKKINLNGNGRTISHLNKPLFDDLNGSVTNLTIKDATVDGGSSITGILANTIKTAASTVTNVDVVGTITTPSYSSSITADAFVGGLIGQIDVGSTNITYCDVSNTNVSGTLAGGVVGFANALVTMSGCTYSGGTVSASARYCGGMLGSTGNYSSNISDCHVENATITSTSDRVGGFIGQIQTNVQVKGCTVGTSSKKVTINSNKSGSTVNVGGFVGVCYGTVTKNVDVRSKAYVTINSTNTSTATNVNIGGFVGFLEKATIEYSDSDVSMSSIKGAQVGGFAAWLVGSGSGCTISHCTMTGTVSGNNYVGGFIGNTGAADHTISYNSSTGTVSGAATVGGFAGQATQGGWTGNTTSSTVVGSGANIGGFAGQINGNVIVSRCSSTGATATASGNVCGGFTAIASNGANISDCFTTTNLDGATRKRGGLVGHVTEGTVSITRCYSTSTISANFELGGLIGVVADGATFTLSKSVAWNASITASNRAASNWSSASIVGVSSLTCTLTDNYRNPDMVLTAYWGTNEYGVELTSSFQQPNVSSTSPLTDWDGNDVTSSTMRPYNGKCETGKTLSQLASTTLGWLDTVWDFSTDLPTLLP